MTAFLLEYFVIFVDCSRAVLSDLIFFFSHAIAPYQVAYNIIYFLPDEKLEFLQESFQQLIVGCLMDKKIFQSRVNLRKTSKKERLVYYVKTDEVDFTNKLDKLKPKLEGIKLGLLEKIKLRVRNGRDNQKEKRRSYFGAREANKKLWEKHNKTVEQGYGDLKTYLWGCQNQNQYMKITFDEKYFATRTIDFLKNLEFKLKNLIDLEWSCFMGKLNKKIQKSNMTLEEYLSNLREMNGLKEEALRKAQEKMNLIPEENDALKEKTSVKYTRSQLQIFFDKKYSDFIFEHEKHLIKHKDIIQKGNFSKFFQLMYKHNSKFLEQFMKTQTYSYFAEKNIRWHLISNNKAEFDDLNDLTFKFF
jgi:hypothetical protein